MRTSVLFAAICLYTSSVLAQQCPTPGPTNWCSGLYQYDGTGNIKFIGADAYTYDALGRLATGTADVQRSGVPSRQTYTYDPYGNRTDVSRDFGSVGCVGGCEIALTVSTITNHITSNGALYDEAGNLHIIQATTGNTTYPATYTYDGAGSLVHAVASDDRQFIYTADDERIATKNGVTWTWTLRGSDNKALREYTSMETNGLPTANLQWVKDYVFRDGLLLASAAPITPGSSTTVGQHYHLDHLGTPRVVTSASGAVIGIHAYYPFGAELDLTPKESNTELLKFTGHERDVLPGGPLSLDAMHARYEMGTLARFLSVDPVISKAAMRSPQIWNRYAYVGNNPMTSIDPDGRLLQLSGCAERKDSWGCTQQYNLYLSTFGNQAQEAAKYLQVGKNGLIGFNGIGGRAFAAKFGMMGRATSYLVSVGATFSLVTGASAKTAEAGGSYFDPAKLGGNLTAGGEIGIDLGAFPAPNRGMITQSAAEALAHEVGHAVGSLIPGIRDALDARLGGQATQTPWTAHEGYSMLFENRWRINVLGAAPNDLRMFYHTPGDVLYSNDAPLFP